MPAKLATVGEKKSHRNVTKMIIFPYEEITFTHRKPTKNKATNNNNNIEISMTVECARKLPFRDWLLSVCLDMLRVLYAI